MVRGGRGTTGSVAGTATKALRENSSAEEKRGAFAPRFVFAALFIAEELREFQ
jgi:hypothetical protein